MALLASESAVRASISLAAQRGAAEQILERVRDTAGAGGAWGGGTGGGAAGAA